MLKKVLFLFFIALSLPSFAEDEVETRDSFDLDVVASSSVTLDSTCLNYCVKGVCVWLVCSISECHLEYTAWIEHRLPDLVVTAYNEPGDSPWDPARSTYGDFSKSSLETVMSSTFGFDFVGGGGRTWQNKASTVEDGEKSVSALRFKETQAIGNPFVNLLNTVSSDYICESETDEFYPYFFSETDGYTWRSAIPELLYPSTWIPGFREISAGDGFVGLFQSWGGIYPRHGFLYNRDDMSAAAVMAARGVDVITRDNQPHIYLQPPIGESDETEDPWQMLYPVEETSCVVFGDPLYPEGRQAPYGGYGWLYWAKHDCCVPNAGVLIEQVELSEPVCLD